MLQELKFQLSTAILTILTLAAGVVAVINFQQNHIVRLHDDGVIWVDRAGSVVAFEAPKDSAGYRAGVRQGDVLMSISRQGVRQEGQDLQDRAVAHGVPVEAALDVPKILITLPSWLPAVYHVRRGNLEFDIRNLVVSEVPLDRVVVYECVVGGVYLVIGLFVYFRRGSAQKALHFYILCLTSFIFFSFHYTGQLNALDKIVYFGNVAAGLFAPALFLHFCLTFPEPFAWFRVRARLAICYLPGTLLLLAYWGFATGALKTAMPLVELRWMLDRIWVPLVTAPYLVGAVALAIGHRHSEDPIVRQQLKWLRNGSFFGIVPFLAFYVLPYTFGAIPNDYLKLSVLSVVLIPLTLAYAIVRYRLMDVDIIFRRGYAYTLATLCVLAAFYGIVFSLGSLVHAYLKDLGNLELISVMLVASFLFQPIRTWIQERLDKHFYRDSYDYRRTLIEFARELSAETDLETMLQLVGERLLQTLCIKHLVFFLADERAADAPPRFLLKRAMGANPRLAGANFDELDLSFLNWDLPEGYLFFERTRHQLDAVSRSWPASVRRTIADLDLNYYLPCEVRGRTIAYLGVSRTTFGDYLSSVDVELLVTLAGYVGIAIENSTLYRSLQRKVEEYERLKEFSENIVESINVGILAADLEDRVESWNTQIEQLSGVPRDRALGRTLRELFPADLVTKFDQVGGETGIHHIYKYVLKPAAPAEGANGNGNGHGSLPGIVREATLNIAIAPLVSKEQERIGRLIIFDDVTDRAELEQRLVQADKLSSIGLLAAGVAHEVNTPLAVISTYAQMLAKQVAEDTQKSIILDKIAKQTFRASEIVNSLLNFSRTSTTTFGPMSLNKVVQETASLLDHQLTKAGISTRLELEDTLPNVHGNAGKLQQVFLNLFLNARDAMPAGGEIYVRSWQEGHGVRVEVCDTGTGIAPEHMRRIYDPFFTTKAARKGTGLGLSVTYGIIQEHGGSIEVSNLPGGGARFHIELPVSKAVESVRAGRQPVSAV